MSRTTGKINEKDDAEYTSSMDIPSDETIPDDADAMKKCQESITRAEAATSSSSSSLKEAREELFHVMMQKQCCISSRDSQLGLRNQSDQERNIGRKKEKVKAGERNGIQLTAKTGTVMKKDEINDTIKKEVHMPESTTPSKTKMESPPKASSTPPLAPKSKTSLLTPSETKFLQSLLSNSQSSAAQLRQATSQLSNPELFPPPIEKNIEKLQSLSLTRGEGMKRGQGISQSYHGCDDRKSYERQLQNYLFRVHATSGVRPSLMLKYLEQERQEQLQRKNNSKRKKDTNGKISMLSPLAEKEVNDLRIMHNRSNSAPIKYGESSSADKGEEGLEKESTTAAVSTCSFATPIATTVATVEYNNMQQTCTNTAPIAVGGEEYSQSSLSTFDSGTPVNNYHLPTFIPNYNSNQCKLPPSFMKEERVVERGVITADQCFITYASTKNDIKEVNGEEDDEGGSDCYHLRKASRASQGFEIDATIDPDTSSATGNNNEENESDTTRRKHHHQRQRQKQYQLQQDGIGSTVSVNNNSKKKRQMNEEEEADVLSDVRTDQEIRPTSEDHVIDEISSWEMTEDENDEMDNVYNHHPDAWDVLKDEYSWGYGYAGQKEVEKDKEGTTHNETIENVVSRAAAAAATAVDDSPPSLPFKIFGTYADDKACQPHVLSPPLMESLLSFMPESLSECNYWLKFSQSRDGSSLYKLLQTVRGSAQTILAIETTEGYVFGSFTSAPWRAHWGYFGGKDSFVWRMRRSRLTPCHSIVEQAMMESELEVFPQTGLNKCIQLCRRDKIGLGAREILDETSFIDGTNEVFNDKVETANDDDIPAMTSVASSTSDSPTHHYGFALSLSSDLLTGTTSTSETFGNPCLTNAKARGERFDVANVEVWAMTSCDTVEEAEREELSRLFFAEEDEKQNDRLNILSILVGS